MLSALKCRTGKNTEEKAHKSAEWLKLLLVCCHLLIFTREPGWSYFVSGSVWWAYITLEGADKHNLSVKPDPKFHINPPVRFWLSRLLLIWFFQTVCLQQQPREHYSVWFSKQLTLSIIDQENWANSFTPEPRLQLRPLWGGQLHKSFFQQMRHQWVLKLWGSKSTIWSCATSSSNTKKGTTPTFCVWDYHRLSDKPATGANWPGAANNRSFSELLLHYTETRQQQRAHWKYKSKPRWGRDLFQNAGTPPSQPSHHPEILSGS